MDEFLKTIIAGLPSFAGLVLAVLILREQNQRLLGMLERHWKPCEDTEQEKADLLALTRGEHP